MLDAIQSQDKTVMHRHDEFNESQLDVYTEMEPRHFWFQGRRRFLEYAVTRQLRRVPFSPRLPSAIDLGGGCGGWIAHVRSSMPHAFSELAIGDSSPRALELAGGLLDPNVARHHIDLRSLPWRERWDVAFLLDVLEHIRDDADVLRQIALSLRPGGLLFVTTPAFKTLWSYNDDLEHHARRYTRVDFHRLAGETGFELVDARYFMFFLSPLLVMSRWFGPDVRRMNRDRQDAHYRKTHRIPAWPLNGLLRAAFNLETPLGHWIRFPFGTSVLAVLRRRCLG